MPEYKQRRKKAIENDLDFRTNYCTFYQHYIKFQA
jgi:hypothetical protein